MRLKERFRACPLEHRAVVLHAISPISTKLCQFKGSTTKLRKLVSVLVFSGGDRAPPPPFFLGFHQGNRFKISKMYEALTAMVFNQLLGEFAHIFLHPKLMPAASISQFDGRLVNQQRRINDCGSRFFDSSKYLTILRSNTSPCQKAITLILIPLYNPSFHL